MNGMDADEIKTAKEQNGQDDTRRQYNAESAGEYIGQSRFVHREQEAKAQEDKKHARNTLAMLMLSSQFSERWYYVQEQLNHAQVAVYDAIHHLQDKLEKQRENAARTLDNQLVFLDENNQAVTEDGQAVSRENIQVGTLTENTTRLKDYQQTQSNLELMFEHDQELIDIMDKMDEIKDNPSEENLELLKGFEERIQQVEAKALEVVNDPKAQAGLETRPVAPSSLPDLKL